jgi:rubrerythrin
MQFNTVDDILNFAIKNEEEAAEFYTGLAKKMDQPLMVKLFED